MLFLEIMTNCFENSVTGRRLIEKQQKRQRTCNDIDAYVNELGSSELFSSDHVLYFSAVYHRTSSCSGICCRSEK